MKKYIILLYTCLISVGALWSQRAPRPSSPDVHSDNRVTFRYFAPNANEVKLSGEFLASPANMVKDTSGIWSITTEPVKPDIYPYFFIEDGVQLSDPNNTYLFSNERFKRSVVEITGDKPLVHSLKDVPHGRIEYRYYESSSLGRTRQLLVYTPPGYDTHSNENYPVLYLIHGGSDTEETWTTVGKAHLIADNLIADGKAKPMIIVMPYGNVRPSAMPDFTKDIANDIIPYVDNNFRTIKNSDNRAVAGFSVGGGQTLNIGFTNLDKFGYICSYAPYTMTEEFKTNFSDWKPNPKAINDQLKLFTISVGTEDFLYESVKQNIEMFKQKGVEIEPIIVSGGHTWMNCKLFLAQSLQQIFK